MAVSLVSTGVQFPDSSIQTTAATAGPAPGWVYLSQVSASSSSTVDVENAFDSTYSTYVIQGVGAYPNSTNTAMRARMKIGGTYVTSSYQIMMTDNTSAGGAWSAQQTNSTTSVALSRYMYGADASYTYNFTMYIPNPSSTTTRKSVYGYGVYYDTAPSTINNTFASSYTGGTGALTGIRFFMDGGWTITAGTFRLYGIKAS